MWHSHWISYRKFDYFRAEHNNGSREWKPEDTVWISNWIRHRSFGRIKCDDDDNHIFLCDRTWSNVGCCFLLANEISTDENSHEWRFICTIIVQENLPLLLCLPFLLCLPVSSTDIVWHQRKCSKGRDEIIETPPLAVRTT